MAETIQQVQYYYTEIPDKPGEGARVLSLLKDTGVNLLGFTGFPKGRKAQVDFIASDSAALKAAAKSAKLKVVGPKKAFLIQGEDRLGALANILSKLAASKINLTALSAVSEGTGRYGALLWVKQRDFNRAARVLGANVPSADSEPAPF